MKTAVIDYGAGNLRSVTKALQAVAPKNQQVFICSEASQLKEATHIVLPGVGAFADCMNGLKSLPGMLDALQQEVMQKQKPFLGICVGMQMLFERGIEHGVHPGLGWLKGEVVALQPAASLRIPHMGWNTLELLHSHPVLAGIESGEHVYYVHSYHCVAADKTDVLAVSQYGQPVTAMVARDNIVGTQFHPEKSQKTGLKLLLNFLTHCE
jgi:imidazole glycerol-phosphate synthase subunit HisH